MFLTSFNCGEQRAPSLVASEASMVAILAQRITDGAGSPAFFNFVTGTSPAQPLFCALVIIMTHNRPCKLWSLPAEMTRAGRDCRVERSVYGKGTLMMSPCLKIGISLLVCCTAPFIESTKRVVCLIAVPCLGNEHLPICDLIFKNISGPKVQGTTN